LLRQRPSAHPLLVEVDDSPCGGGPALLSQLRLDVDFTPPKPSRKSADATIKSRSRRHGPSWKPCVAELDGETGWSPSLDESFALCGDSADTGELTPATDVPTSLASSSSAAREEEVNLPLTGWLQVAKAKVDLTQRVAVWAAQPQSNAVGWVMSRCLWVRRLFELTDDRLCCWASPEQREMAMTRPLQLFPLAQVDEVAVNGCDIRLHFRDGQASSCLRASSQLEAEQWSTAIRQVVARALCDDFPVGWDVQAMLTPRDKGDSVARLVNKERLPQATVDVVQQLVDHAFFCKRKTKDRRGDVPLRLVVEEVLRVENGSAWQDYDKERARIRGECAGALEPLDPEVLTSLLGAPALVSKTLGELDPACQEQWLFHGTTAAAVQGISDGEFRMDFAGRHRGTLYGKGLYLAECSSKADEYAEEDGHGVCSMLLCRASLGKILVDKEAKPSADLDQTCPGSGYHSLCGDRWAAVGTYREFVLYHASRVYPAYIMRYRRVSEAGLCMSMRQALDFQDAVAARTIVPYAARLAHEHSDRDIRYRLTLLLTSQDGFVVPALVHALSDPRPRVRCRAAATLAKVASEVGLVQLLDDGTLHRRTSDKDPAVASAVPALIKALSDSDAGVRRAAALALEPLGQHARKAVPALSRRLEDEDASVRRAVALALGKLGAPSEPAVPALGQRVATDESEDVRAAAATALGYLNGLARPTVHILEDKLLSDPYTQVRVAAAFALGQMGTHAAPAVASLIKCLTDPEAHVRRAVACAISFLGPRTAKAATPVLGRCVKDPDEEVRRAAAVALGHMGVAAVSAEEVAALSDGLVDSKAQVRRACAMALGRLGEAALPAVRRLVKVGLVDSSDEVRAAVAGALVDLVQHDGLGANAQLVEQEMTVRLKDHCDEVRKAAAMCLRRFKKDFGHPYKLVCRRVT